MQSQSPWWLVIKLHLDIKSFSTFLSLYPSLSHSALTMSNQLDDSILLLATPPLKSTSGVFALKPSADRRQDANTFTAPVGGAYLLALSLDLRPGPAHLVVLRGRELGQVVLHQHLGVESEAGPVTKTALVRLNEGEGLRVELSGQVWSESEDNMLAVLLLQQAT